MNIDKNKNAVDNVIALINDANDVNWTADMVVVATPAAVTDGSHGGRNTRVLVTAVPGRGLRGSNTFYYNRLGMLDNVAEPQTTYSIEEGTNDATLFAAVVEALGLVPSEVELVEPLVDQMPQITLQPKGISLLYNEPATLTLNWLSATLTIEQLLPNGDMPGFVIPSISVPALLNVTDLPGFQKVTKSQWMWKVDATTRQSNTNNSTLVVVGDKVWYADGELLRAYSTIDGEVLFELNLRAHFGTAGGTNLYYRIDAVDANNVLWVLGDAPAGQKQLVRFDTDTMLIVDELAPAGLGDVIDQYDLMNGTGSSDFVWARHDQRPSGGSLTFKLARFDVTTGAATDFTIGITASSIFYDNVAKKVWVGYSGGGGLSKYVNVYSLDGSNNPVLLKTNQLWYTTAGQFACAYETGSGREVAIFDQDVDNDYAMYIRRYNATTGDWIADMKITTPNATPENGSMGPNGLLKYNATTDEFYASVYTATGSEIWAFKRTDVTQSRLVAAMAGSDEPWDYAMDVAGGKTFAFYESGGDPMNYLTQMRQA